MHYSANSTEELLSYIPQCSVGDSIDFIKSAFVSDSINYNEFSFNLRASQLGGDILKEKHGADRYKLTFVEKQPHTNEKYSTIYTNEDNPILEAISKPIANIVLGDKVMGELKPLSTPLQVKKGDKIEDKFGFVGVIIKYSSNASILVRYDINVERIISKDQIKQIVK